MQKYKKYSQIIVCSRINKHQNESLSDQGRPGSSEVEAIESEAMGTEGMVCGVERTLPDQSR